MTGRLPSNDCSVNEKESNGDRVIDDVNMTGPITQGTSYDCRLGSGSGPETEIKRQGLRPVFDVKGDGDKMTEENSYPSRKGLSRWLSESVSPQSMVKILILQAWATGVLDATTYADFNTFASNQTGNVILLTLSAVGTTKILLLLTGVSLAGFIGGAFIFGHLGHLFGVRRRAWLLLTTSIQAILLIASLFILLFAPASYQPEEPSSTTESITTVANHGGGDNQFVILFLFALMSGAQVVMARQSSCQELPTAPMTSPMVDLVSDKYLFDFRIPFWRPSSYSTSSSSTASHSTSSNAGHRLSTRRREEGGEDDKPLAPRTVDIEAQKQSSSSSSHGGRIVDENKAIEKTDSNSKRKSAIESRNRRIAYILAMVVGSFIGAVLHRYVGSWLVVLLSTVCKLIALVMLGLAKADS